MYGFLFKKYPLLYRRGLSDGFAFGNANGTQIGEGARGWVPLVEGLSAKLEAILEEMPPHLRFAARCVKEKFGLLRFYLEEDFVRDDLGEEEILYVEEIEDRTYSLIETAANTSGTMCIECGERGSLRWDILWKRVLCEEHFQEVLKFLPQSF